MSNSEEIQGNNSGTQFNLRNDPKFANRPNWTTAELNDLDHEQLVRIGAASRLKSRQKDSYYKTELLNHPKIRIEEANEIYEEDLKSRKAATSAEYASKNKEQIRSSKKASADRKAGKDPYHIEKGPPETFEPALYNQFKQWIEDGDNDWDHLSMPLKSKPNVEKFNALNDLQKDYFFLMVKQLIERVDREIGPENFFGTKGPWYNIVLWVNFILQLSKIEPYDNDNSCRILMGQNVNGTTLRPKLYARYKGTFYQPNAYRVALWLNPINGSILEDASHGCINGKCTYYIHIYNESRKINLKRNSCLAHKKYGCIKNCKCVNGFCFPNNNGTFVGCHLHGIECYYEALLNKSKEHDSKIEEINIEFTSLKIEESSSEIGVSSTLSTEILHVKKTNISTILDGNDKQEPLVENEDSQKPSTSQQ